MINLRKRKDEEFKIDISSLVDVLFTLLIFFSLTSTFVQDSGLDIELPEASSSVSLSNPERIDIVIKKSGEISMDGEKIDLDHLQKQLTNFDKNQKLKYLIVLKADNATTHGTVTLLLDLLKKNGFKNIAIGTRSSR